MPKHAVDRRKGPDLWLRILTWSGVLSGISLIAALYITALAKPEIETFFDRYYNLRLRQTWDMEMMHYILYLMLLSLFSSMVGLIINSRRKRRKHDQVRVSLIVILLISVLGLVQYMIFQST